ncbi:hypothetical protein Tco_1071944 [Tanacetum coccineum]
MPSNIYSHSATTQIRGCYNISQSCSSGAHKGTGVTPGVPDVPTYESDDEQISWKSSAEDDDDEENVSEHEDDDDDERTESDNDGDDFFIPSFQLMVMKQSKMKNDDVIQDANIEGDMINEEETHEEVRANVLYRDVNVNLEGSNTVMTDVLLPNVQATQETEDTHVILTALINPEGIDSIFNLNKEATSLVDVSVTTIAEPPLVSATTIPLPPTPLITHMQKTIVPIPTTVPSTSLQDLPNFGSLFGSNEQKNLYKALVEAYESDKLILDTYGDIVSFKRRIDDEDKDEEPSAGSNRGSKRKRAGKEPESTSATKE